MAERRPKAVASAQLLTVERLMHALAMTHNNGTPLLGTWCTASALQVAVVRQAASAAAAGAPPGLCMSVSCSEPLRARFVAQATAALSALLRQSKAETEGNPGTVLLG